MICHLPYFYSLFVCNCFAHEQTFNMTELYLNLHFKSVKVYVVFSVKYVFSSNILKGIFCEGTLIQ